jgi:hypothetical protein
MFTDQSDNKYANIKSTPLHDKYGSGLVIGIQEKLE